MRGPAGSLGLSPRAAHLQLMRRTLACGAACGARSFVDGVNNRVDGRLTCAALTILF